MTNKFWLLKRIWVDRINLKEYSICINSPAIVILDQPFLEYIPLPFFVKNQIVITLHLFVENQTSLSHFPLLVANQTSISPYHHLYFKNQIAISLRLSKVLCLTQSLWPSHIKCSITPPSLRRESNITGKQGKLPCWDWKKYGDCPLLFKENSKVGGIEG